ncbi:MAG: hypothetical protein ACTH0F_16765 [Microbacterium sp.]
MRIMLRIIVLHMSAVFMQAGAQSMPWVEHTVHACSQAEHASMHACIIAMSMVSMPGIFMLGEAVSIIIASISQPSVLLIRKRAGRPPAARVRPPVTTIHRRAR